MDLNVKSASDGGYQGGNQYSLYITPAEVNGYTDDVEMIVPPYTTVSFGSLYQTGIQGGLQLDFTVTDASGNVLATFETHQHDCGGIDDTWIDNVTSDREGGWFYTWPQGTTQSNSNPGIIQIGIYTTN
jgi:hypothetical protein